MNLLATTTVRPQMKTDRAPMQSRAMIATAIALQTQTVTGYAMGMKWRVAWMQQLVISMNLPHSVMAHAPMKY